MLDFGGEEGISGVNLWVLLSNGPMKTTTFIFVLAAFLGSGLASSAEELQRSSLQPQERPRLSFTSPIHADHVGQPRDGLSGGVTGQEWGRPWFVPGLSSFWFAAGSDGYVGGGISIRQPFMIKGVPFYYGLAVSREQGNDWFSGLDYRTTSISPSLEWHGERTSAYVSFTAAETNLSGTLRPVFSPGAFGDERVDNRLSSRSAQVFVHHHLFENLDISVSVQGGTHSLGRR